MISALVRTQTEWRAFDAYGSQVHLKSGTASTLRTPKGCPQGWFSGNSTTILGAGSAEGKEKDEKTVAYWDIPVDPDWVERFQRGFLIVACRRYFGGLHTQKYDAKVDILLNDKSIDSFGLKVIPPEHTDYFHRIPTPNLPDLWPFSGCQTVYAWPVLKNQLTESGDQTVTLRMDRDVNWDIDYVALAIRTESPGEPAKWIQQLIFLLLGALFGGVVSLLVS